MSRVLPEDYSPEVAKRLRHARRQLALGAGEMAAKVQVSRGYWSELENAKAAPGPKLLSALARVYRINPAWLLRNEGQAFLGDAPQSKQVEGFADLRIWQGVQDSAAQTAYPVKPDAAHPRGGHADAPSRNAPLSATNLFRVGALFALPAMFELRNRQREYLVIPSIEVAALAGRTTARKEEERRIAASAAGVLAMDRVWMAEQLGRADAGFATVSVSGDSMNPTLHDGDMIIIDTLVDKIEVDGIYVLRRGDVLVVKRAHLKMDGSAVVRGDNEGYEPELMQPATVRELRVVGRMVWPRVR
jgi:transcriptional regulator with XRE-family HTH domain